MVFYDRAIKIRFRATNFERKCLEWGGGISSQSKKLFFVKSPTKLFSYEKCFSAARGIVILAPFIFPKNGPHCRSSIKHDSTFFRKKDKYIFEKILKERNPLQAHVFDSIDIGICKFYYMILPSSCSYLIWCQILQVFGSCVSAKNAIKIYFAAAWLKRAPPSFSIFQF